MNPDGTRSKTEKETLQEVKARLKSEKNKCATLTLNDVYAKAEEAFSIERKKTGICMHDRMVLHKCEWDRHYPENPERYRCIIKRLNDLHLLEKCEILKHVTITKDIVLTKHTEELYNKLYNVTKFNLAELEIASSEYDSIYFNKHTNECAQLSLGCVLSVLKNVCTGKVQNGMAIVRPPGHHAMKSEYCGYCYFNNVAIAAQQALDEGWAKKILIVDYDVHHGQATQEMFYDDDRVLYFSWHRYEHGSFWPNLRESNFDFIGRANGEGYNINFPLNAIELKDADYMAAVSHILLPVAYEYNPDLIIVSAGYDSCLGCPEGEMDVTPGFYGHLITLLSGLANGKIVVALEGGYFPPSLAEGVAMTVRGLLDEAPAFLDTEREKVHHVVKETINDLKIVLHPHWKCFQIYPLVHKVGELSEEYHRINIKFRGFPESAPFPTREFYATKNEVSLERDTWRIEELCLHYDRIKDGPVLSYTYDDIMLDHESKQPHPESPDRLKRVHEMFCAAKLDTRCHRISGRKSTLEELTMIHDHKYANSLIKGIYKPESSDIYFNAKSINSILHATGSLLNVIDSVFDGPYRAGAAFIRPPGHHAERGEAQGFCFVSNVAVAAKYILKKNMANKILIVDFDIHHGNGTQRAFYDNGDVLYISIHKYDDGKFYPYGTDGNYDKAGAGNGIGRTVNIPFNEKKMNDIDYIYVFHAIVLPIAYSFNPHAVLISAGFDAGIKDTIGNYNISPECFGHFVQMLKPFAWGKLILALEGGYNITTLGYSMIMCVKALLGDPLPKLNIENQSVQSTTITTIENVINFQKEHWPILGIGKKLVTEHLAADMENLRVQ